MENFGRFLGDTIVLEPRQINYGCNMLRISLGPEEFGIVCVTGKHIICKDRFEEMKYWERDVMTG